MNEGLYAIVGGLVGSVATITVTKIFDLAQLGKQHKLSLKKELFLRKIDCFEKTVSCWTIAHSSFSNISALLNSVKNENSYYDEKTIDNIANRIDGQIKAVYTDTLAVANAIGLYMEVEGSEEIVLTESFYQLCGQLNSISLDIAHCNALFDDTSDYQSKRNIQLSIDKLMIDAEQTVNQLSELTLSIRLRYLKLTSQLRDELKKHE